MPASSLDPQQQQQQQQQHAQDGFPGKDCKACEGAMHMFSSFRKLAQQGAGKAGSSNPDASSSTGTSSSSASGRASAAAAGNPASRERLPCPPDTTKLGSATWTFLHTMAAYYPEQPSAAQRSVMRSMMDGLAEFYPCHVCAAHLREQVRV